MNKLNIMIAALTVVQELYDDPDAGFISVNPGVGDVVMPFVHLTEKAFKKYFAEYRNEGDKLVTYYAGVRFMCYVKDADK